MKCGAAAAEAPIEQSVADTQAYLEVRRKAAVKAGQVVHARFKKANAHVYGYLQAHPAAPYVEVVTHCKCSESVVRIVKNDLGLSKTRRRNGRCAVQDVKFGRWTSQFTEGKHQQHHHLVGRLLTEKRFDAYVDMNAGPGIYTPDNAKVEKETICSGLWAVRRVNGMLPVYLWENDHEICSELYARLKVFCGQFQQEFGQQPPVHVFHETNGQALERLASLELSDRHLLVYADPEAKGEVEMSMMLRILNSYSQSTLLFHGCLGPWDRSCSDRGPLDEFVKTLRKHRANCCISDMRGAYRYYLLLATNWAFKDAMLHPFSSCRGRELLAELTHADPLR